MSEPALPKNNREKTRMDAEFARRFFEKARNKFGDRFDFSKTIYSSRESKVEIGCEKHGFFWIFPESFIKNAVGCPKCGFEKIRQDRTSTKEEFIAKAQKKFGEKFDYSQVYYSCSSIPIQIGCPKHGAFRIIPNNFLRSRGGCPSCGRETFQDGDRRLFKKNLDILFCEFLRKASKKFPNGFDFSNVNYLGSNHKIKIKCKIHGIIEVTPGRFLVSERGCPKCSKKERHSKTVFSTKNFIKRAEERFGFNFDYSKTNYEGNRKEIIIKCPSHGLFITKPSVFLGNKYGCPTCCDEKFLEKSKSLFLTQSSLKFKGKFDYSRVCFTGRDSKIIIGCPVHGFFSTTPSLHRHSDFGCPNCASDFRGENHRLNGDEVVKMLQNKFGDKYDYSDTEYTGWKDKIKLFCKKHGVFETTLNSLVISQHGCPICAARQSKPEELFSYFLDSFKITYKQNTRKVIHPKELDFFIPNLNLAIEYNGLYWHSESCNKGINYHLNKTLNCQAKGINLIHIFENEFLHKPRVVFSMLRRWLNCPRYSIPAAECDVREVGNNDKSRFLDKYHLEGECKSEINLGLYYKNNLVSVVAISKDEVNSRGYKVLRFSSNFLFYVIGGDNKILSFFEQKFSPKSIICEVNRRWDYGNKLVELGFLFQRNSLPRVWAFKTDFTEGIFNIEDYTKIIQESPDKEHQFHHVWDCGTSTYLKTYGQN